MKQKHLYEGLNDEQVLASRAKHGANILTPAKKESLWMKFLSKFEDPLIIILLVAGVLSICISFYEYYGLGHSASTFFEPVGIFVAIILATGLGFIFEVKADREFAILNQVNDEEPVIVIRNGSATEIPKKDVVVDDIVMLELGNEIPADGELLDAVSLQVDESTLTGEPICHKSVDKAQFDDEATFPTNHVMRGTKVMEGHGVCRVLAVGDKTENGKVFEAAQIDNSVRTPLNEQLDRLGKMITIWSYLIGSLVIVSRITLYFVEMEGAMDWVDFVSYFLQTIMIAVTLIVVSVPEGLPMAVTLSLAYSMRRMLKTNNLVRKMHACETMGATTVICTDKTGTLTQNQMQVYETQFYGLGDQKLGDDELSEIVKASIATNSTASLDTNGEKPKVLGNPTEGALLLWLDSRGVDYLAVKESMKVLAQVPFSTERKYMATVVRDEANSRRILLVKGAPEIVYGLCKNYPAGATQEAVTAQLQQYQNQAMRTLGFAYQILSDGEVGIEEDKLAATDLTFLGIVAISDPVREDVPAAVKECIDAGIGIKIVTGDTPGTAKEIGRQIGLWSADDGEENIITGPEFAALDDDTLKKRINDIKIISRARPMDKKRLVETLQGENHVVAVTGDGTNDAPALKAAHVGLSMGDGTSVAKEASDITIIDNSFSSITLAVMWGRSLYQNIQRFILFQLTVNVVACLIVLFGTFMGKQSPLSVTQMLWVNLIMDTLAAMALASLPPSRGVMKDAPRDRNSFIINRLMRWDIIGVGLIFFVILFALLYVLDHTNITSLMDLANAQFVPGKSQMTDYELSLFFTIFVMLQFWNMFNARAFQSCRSAFHFKHCGEYVMISLGIVVGQVLIVTFGYDMFNVVPLKLTDWLIIIVGTSPVLLVGELVRLLKKRPARCSC